MKSSLIHLVRYAIAQGNTVSVNDGGEWAVKRSKNEREIIAAVESVDEAIIRIRTVEGIECGQAYIVNGLEPEELVADYVDNVYFSQWNKAYWLDNGHEIKDIQID